jgi:5-methyltetrahydropteroyltriglutamate--homocysteine methyltransferase
MTQAINLGFPRIGAHRELKVALEAYWAGKVPARDLLATAKQIRLANWKLQQAAGLHHIPSNDFSLYDQMLDTAAMLGAIPERFGHTAGTAMSLDCYFMMARGMARKGETENTAMEMTKWFDTNYHYIVPELSKDQSFAFTSKKVLAEYREAKDAGIETRPVIIGPLTFLLLAKSHDESCDPLSLLDRLVPVYQEILQQLEGAGAAWIQIDEPALILNLSPADRKAYVATYAQLAASCTTLKIAVATYFGDLRDNLDTALALSVDALHLDAARGPAQIEIACAQAPKHLILSLGVVDGRNIWCNNLGQSAAIVKKAIATCGPERIWVGPSCSLLHAPIDLDLEKRLDPEIKQWMAFATQKVAEIVAIADAAQATPSVATQETLAANAQIMASRRSSSRIHNPAVKDRIAAITPAMAQRHSPFAQRREAQQQALPLPAFPTTTIGSLPQTQEVRQARAKARKGDMSVAEYQTFLERETEKAVRWQERLDLDVLVHGEFERNDMVEYFGEQLEGYVSTKLGWVQSYGSRCVKPPIIFGDIARKNAMTVDWWNKAQSFATRPVKGMLTGPVTMLQWSFVRDDQPRSVTCQQLALTIRDEVVDLETAGCVAIQVDEPALREGLPLRREDWAAYLHWGVEAFRLTTCGVKNTTQIHTHMCYSEFNDIIEAIGAMDADVISIEASRSQLELLSAFTEYQYPNYIGPGVYDIHSPRVPSQDEITQRLEKMAEVLQPEQIWVNPDCGLKTRRWEEIEPALTAMVQSAKSMRALVKRKVA